MINESSLSSSRVSGSIDLLLLIYIFDPQSNQSFVYLDETQRMMQLIVSWKVTCQVLHLYINCQKDVFFQGACSDSKLWFNFGQQTDRSQYLRQMGAKSLTGTKQKQKKKNRTLQGNDMAHFTTKLSFEIMLDLQYIFLFFQNATFGKFCLLHISHPLQVASKCSLFETFQPMMIIVLRQVICIFLKLFQKMSFLFLLSQAAY